MPQTEKILKSEAEIKEEILARRGISENPKKNVRNALDKLGKPDSSYKTILVGGSNGKGSTVEMIAELLKSQGFNVGVSKSPHLVEVNERIRFNDSKVTNRELAELYREIEDIEVNLAFYEFMSTASYLYFGKKNVDYAVVEIGKGGVYDSGNAVRSEISTITNIQLEHTEFLGENKKEIAEKIGGITPKNGKIVTNEEYAGIEMLAEHRNCEIKKPFRLEKDNGKYIYNSKKFEIPLRGSFQRENLENALKTVDEVEELPENLTEAFSDLSSPGRMEIMSKEPLYIHDGAHNPAAVKKVIQDLPEKFICIFNSTKGSRHKEMIKKLEEKAEKFYITSSEFFKSEKPEKIAEKCEKDFEIEENPDIAEKKALSEGKEKSTPVVAIGSLYLIGRLREQVKH